MKYPYWLLPGLFLFSCSSAWAIERLPIEDFAREPVINKARLSPDGKHLAFLADHNLIPNLFVSDLAGGKVRRLDFGRTDLPNSPNLDVAKGVSFFFWVGNHRLIANTDFWIDAVNFSGRAGYGLRAIDADGKNGTPLGGQEIPKFKVDGLRRMFASVAPDLGSIIHFFNDEDSTILMLNRKTTTRFGRNDRPPDVVRMNTMSAEVNLELENSGDVMSYGVDFDGVVRMGLVSRDGESGVIYRANAQAPWQTILPVQKREGRGLRPISMIMPDNRIFVTDFTKERRLGLFAVDLAAGMHTELLLSDPEYDIVPQGPWPSIDGVGLAGPVFSRNKRTLVGIRYYTEAPRVKWLDRSFVKNQMAVDKYLPDTVNVLVNESADGKKQLWFAFSDRHPGDYQLLDLENKTFKGLDSRMPWIKPAQMAPMLAIKYPARDGMGIHGYLTVPLGHEPKNLPLVVLPHGSRPGRDLWEFNPLIQLIANRGYAVLQMNYRGSTGYGEEFKQVASRGAGGKIQEDIEDAARWAVSSGVADPRRIAIVGQEFGGYSALFALAYSHDLYCCGVSISGITDWPALFDHYSEPQNSERTRFIKEMAGDPEKDRASLEAISPVNFAGKIAAPVLIIQGMTDLGMPPIPGDQGMPQSQGNRMIAALKKAGRTPESLLIVPKQYGKEKERIEVFKSIVGFLEKNLGPGVP